MQSRLSAQAFGAQNFARCGVLSPFALLCFGAIAARCPNTQLNRLSQLRHHPLASRRPISTQPPSPLHELEKKSEGSKSLVFQSSSTNPYHNLSIEDYLLRNSHHSSRILFFYSNRPCVVIGRNQNPWLECNLQSLREGLLKGDVRIKHGSTIERTEKAELIPIDLVRRRSGGGTVFHDLGNLNYSVIVPNDKDFNRRRHAEMVVRALDNVTEYDFFANIKVNDRHDIVMQKHGQDDWLKISGSAFKLTKGRALHHGTLLYSSPYLHDISGLLKSPGRGFIHAKGVESVRSKVGNLLWIASHLERERLRAAVVDKVTGEFLNLYGDGSTGSQHGQLPIQVGDEDCHEETNAALAEGVRELMTKEWRFDQTPRFDFHSGTVNGFELCFQANRGAIEALSIHTDTLEGELSAAGVTRGRNHLHNIQDWKVTVSKVEPRSEFTSKEHSELKNLRGKVIQNEALMRQLEITFPHLD